jgi:hypothetical protein
MNAMMNSANAATATFALDRFLLCGVVSYGSGARGAPQDAQNEVPSCKGALHLGQFRYIPPSWSISNKMFARSLSK